MRKADHIRLALQSQLSQNDDRFYYEPLLGSHPDSHAETGFQFLGKQFEAPIWISSMTGGTELAGTINSRLASACGKYGLGMGLGSCRMILEDDTYLRDFQLRKFAGDKVAIYANLGIAQVENLIERKRTDLIRVLINKTETDGLIVHVNPLQEWLQPEGDHIRRSPLDTISELLEKIDVSLIVKEVGQGMGPESLKALSKMPLAAIDFAAFGGTNFTHMEAERRIASHRPGHEILAYTGHTAEEMISFYNKIHDEAGYHLPPVIISGGVQNFLDGFYYLKLSKSKAIYGQASAFLKAAMEGEENLDIYVRSQIEGLKLAENLLRIKE